LRHCHQKKKKKKKKQLTNKESEAVILFSPACRRWPVGKEKKKERKMSKNLSLGREKRIAYDSEHFERIQTLKY
jgi:hypothetical protein